MTSPEWRKEAKRLINEVQDWSLMFGRNRCTVEEKNAPRAALLAHLDATPAVQPIGYVSRANLTNLKDEGWVPVWNEAHRIAEGESVPLYAAPQAAQLAMDAPVHSEAVSSARPQITDERLDAIFAAHHNPEEAAWVNYRRYGRAVLADQPPQEQPEVHQATDSVVCGAKTALPVLIPTWTDAQLQTEADALSRRIAHSTLPARDAMVVIELANRLIRARSKS